MGATEEKKYETCNEAMKLAVSQAVSFMHSKFNIDYIPDIVEDMLKASSEEQNEFNKDMGMLCVLCLCAVYNIAKVGSAAKALKVGDN